MSDRPLVRVIDGALECGACRRASEGGHRAEGRRQIGGACRQSRDLDGRQRIVAGEAEVSTWALTIRPLAVAAIAPALQNADALVALARAIDEGLNVLSKVAEPDPDPFRLARFEEGLQCCRDALPLGVVGHRPRSVEHDVEV